MNTEAGLVKSFVLTPVGRAMALVSDKFKERRLVDGWCRLEHYFFKMYNGQ